MNNKKGIANTSSLQKLFDESKRKQSKIRADKGCEVHNKNIKSLLKDNNVEMYSTHNEGTSVVDERFIRTSKNKIYKCMNSKLINQMKYSIHPTIHIIVQSKLSPRPLKTICILTLVKKSNDKDPKFKFGNYVIISK